METWGSGYVEGRYHKQVRELLKVARRFHLENDGNCAKSFEFVGCEFGEKVALAIGEHVKILQEKINMTPNTQNATTHRTTTKVLKMDALERLKGDATDATGANAPPTITLPKIEGGRVVIDIRALEPGLQEKVTGWYGELAAGMRGMAVGSLEIGRVLAEARAELKPLGVWMAFLNRVPGMTARTGDRFIKRFEFASKHLPPAVLALAVASGTDLGGVDARKPYGRFTGAVKRVGAPPRTTGNAERDNEKARVWFARVLVAGKRRRPTPTANPVEKAASALEHAVRAHSETSGAQLTFLANVLRVVTKRLEMKNSIVLRGRGSANRANAA